MHNIVVLLSGGMDSATVLAICADRRKTVPGLAIHALSFDYGQRHRVELRAAADLATLYGCASHRIAKIDLRIFGGSALTDDFEVPKNRTIDPSKIPITYVPARNTIFLSYALALAEVTDSRSIHLGVNALDYSGYPDCRREYLQAFANLADLATKSAVEERKTLSIVAPLIESTKADIVRIGTELGVDYSRTISCYDPDDNGRACGHCDACVLRRAGFHRAGIVDPTMYKESDQ